MSDLPGGPTPPPPPPPPGTPAGPGSMRPRTLGEILSAAFDIYKTNAAQLIVIVAVVVIPLSLIGALIGQAFAGNEEVVAGRTITDRSVVAIVLGAIVAAVVAIIISAILQAAMMRAAALATIGDPVDVSDSYRWGLKRFGSVLLVAFLVGLMIAIGFILIIIPGIIFLTLLSVSIPAVVIENRRGTDAMKRSWDLAKEHFWHVLGVVVVAWIITTVIGSILGSLGGDNWFGAWIFSAIAQILTAPFSALVSVLLYLDLRARKEALTADSLRSELAQNA